MRPGGIYASLKDVTQSADLLGSVARLPNGGPVGRLTQDTVRLDLVSDGVTSDFLYWSLQTPNYRDYCRRHSTGTTTLGLPRDDFLSYPIWLPSIDEQRRIAGVLGALDDLAALEAFPRRNSSEDLARAVASSATGSIALRALGRDVKESDLVVPATITRFPRLTMALALNVRTGRPSRVGRIVLRCRRCWSRG